MSDSYVLTCQRAEPELLRLEFNDPNPDKCAECGLEVVVSRDGRKLQAEKKATLLCLSCTRKKMEDPEFNLAGPVPGEWETRVEELRKEVMAELGFGVALAAWIVCNGCGRRARVWSDEDLAGWHIGGHRAGTDLCPECQKAFLR